MEFRSIRDILQLWPPKNCSCRFGSNWLSSFRKEEIIVFFCCLNMYYFCNHRFPWLFLCLDDRCLQSVWFVWRLVILLLTIYNSCGLWWLVILLTITAYLIIHFQVFSGNKIPFAISENENTLFPLEFLMDIWGYFIENNQ